MLTGCWGTGGHGLISSLDDLTSETDRQGFSDINQNRIISISGSLPNSMPGTIFRYRKARSASTSFGISTGATYILHKTIRAPDDASNLVDRIRNAILDVRLAAARTAVARLRQIELENALGSKDSATREAATRGLAQAQDDVSAAQRDLEDKTRAASAQVTRPGIVVFRWATTDRETGSVKSLFGINARRDSKASGYCIAAGWRESTLCVGRDILELYDDALNMKEAFHYKLVLLWNWFPWFFYFGEDEDLRITTRTVQVQSIAYLQDVDVAAAIAAALDTTLEQLTDNAALLNELRKVQIDLEFATAAILSNEARLEGAVWSTTTCEGVLKVLNGPDTLSVIDSHESPQPGDWQTIFAVDTDLKALKNLF